MNSLVKLVNPVMGLEDAAHLTTSHPLAKKKKEIEKKKRFRSFVRGDTIFVISNNRRSPRERETGRYTRSREDTAGARASRRAEFNDRGYLANITYHEIRERDRNVK